LVMARYNPGAAVGGDPLTAMLESWYIQPRTDQVLFRERLGPDRQKQANVRIRIDRWPDQHPVSQPLGSMQGLFMVPSPLEIEPGAEDLALPPVPLARIQDDRVWAQSDLSRGQEHKLDPETAGKPYILALAAATDQARLIVTGEPHWASDDIIGLGALGPGSAEMTGAVFPANAELFTNSIYWLAGLEELIATSARTQDIRRIGEISPTAYRSLRWGLLTGLPFVVLLVGLVVWVRRREQR
ncbi:MAG: hypothetical protein R3336_06020, partial [Phycisphaeraceae bacterium]|nr:hypothetical protein [Phycisphaeraceae bacterium]